MCPRCFVQGWDNLGTQLGFVPHQVSTHDVTQPSVLHSLRIPPGFLDVQGQTWLGRGFFSSKMEGNVQENSTGTLEGIEPTMPGSGCWKTRFLMPFGKIPEDGQEQPHAAATSPWTAFPRRGNAVSHPTELPEELQSKDLTSPEHCTTPKSPPTVPPWINSTPKST